MSSPINFYKPSPYNSETKNQIWTTIFTDAHDEFCGCTEPAAHFLNQLIPPDHPSRHQSIDSFIKSCYKRQRCLFGGKEEKDGGEEDTDPGTKEKLPTKREEEEFENINPEELLAAATVAEER